MIDGRSDGLQHLAFGSGQAVATGREFLQVAAQGVAQKSQSGGVAGEERLYGGGVGARERAPSVASELQLRAGHTAPLRKERDELLGGQRAEVLIDVDECELRFAEVARRKPVEDLDELKLVE